MRGNRRDAHACRYYERSIPAHAGQPRDADRERPLHEVYPRACGATSYTLLTALSSRGLSPRMRGNRALSRRNRIITGSIPAHAGQPETRPYCRKAAAVYPRACGATRFRAALPLCSCGLSPRMRGNRHKDIHEISAARSIPAHAGQPSPSHIYPPYCKVYPRACGATAEAIIDVRQCNGLSPRMRGNLCRLRGCGHCAGSIPAHAGQPTGRGGWARAAQVYPRACGATMGIILFVFNSQGLSPRMRGNPCIASCIFSCLGSIPAHAGQPATVIRSAHRGEVYPRACGATQEKK